MQTLALWELALNAGTRSARGTAPRKKKKDGTVAAPCHCQYLNTLDNAEQMNDTLAAMQDTLILSLLSDKIHSAENNAAREIQ